jgi:DDE superfamily endonuclease
VFRTAITKRSLSSAACACAASWRPYDRAMTAETFEAWLEQHLLPTLEEGDIVVLDNLNVHKPTECENFFQACGYDTT